MFQSKLQQYVRKTDKVDDSFTSKEISRLKISDCCKNPDAEQSTFISTEECSSVDTMESNTTETVDLPEESEDHTLDRIQLLTSTKYGVLVQCSRCNKWRNVKEYEEPHQVPAVWNCTMNKDPAKNSCDVPTEITESDAAETNYVPGSIVWAKLSSFPWWPAMVDDDPDEEDYYSLGGKSGCDMKYHVTFFEESVTRSWIPAKSLRPFLRKEKLSLRIFGLNKKYIPAIEKAQEEALQAIQLPLAERLMRYSFAFRWSGEVTESSAKIAFPQSESEKENSFCSSIPDNKPLNVEKALTFPIEHTKMECEVLKEVNTCEVETDRSTKTPNKRLKKEHNSAVRITNNKNVKQSALITSFFMPVSYNKESSSSVKK